MTNPPRVETPPTGSARSDVESLEMVLRSITPRPRSAIDLEITERLYERVRRQVAEHGPPTPPTSAGSVLRTDPPVELPPGCVNGSERAHLCVVAPGGVWVCPDCGAHTTVTARVGPRVPPCECRGPSVCVHPVPRAAARNASGAGIGARAPRR